MRPLRDGVRRPAWSDDASALMRAGRAAAERARNRGRTQESKPMLHPACRVRQDNCVVREELPAASLGPRARVATGPSKGHYASVRTPRRIRRALDRIRVRTAGAMPWRPTLRRRRWSWISHRSRSRQRQRLARAGRLGSGAAARRHRRARARPGGERAAPHRLVHAGRLGGAWRVSLQQRADPATAARRRRRLLPRHRRPRTGPFRRRLPVAGGSPS